MCVSLSRLPGPYIIRPAVSDTVGVETRAQTRTIALQGAIFSGRVRPAEDPVLPGAEPAENARFHGFRPGEAQIGLEAGQGVGRKARPLLDDEADLLVPINLVIGGGDEAHFLRH